MKNLLGIIFLMTCCVSALLGDHIMTEDGKMYFDVVFQRSSARGLEFLHRDGVVRLMPEQLKEQDRMKFAAEIKEFYTRNRRMRQRMLNRAVVELRKQSVPQQIVRGNALLKEYGNQSLNLLELQGVIAEAKSKLAETFASSVAALESLESVEQYTRGSIMLKEYQNLGMDLSSLQSIVENAALLVPEDFAAAVKELKTLPFREQFKVGQALLQKYAAAKVDLTELRNIVANAMDNEAIAVMTQKIQENNEFVEKVGNRNKQRIAYIRQKIEERNNAIAAAALAEIRQNQSNGGGVALSSGRRCAACIGRGFVYRYRGGRTYRIVCGVCRGSGDPGMHGDYLDSSGRRHRSLVEQQLYRMMLQ